MKIEIKGLYIKRRELEIVTHVKAKGAKELRRYINLLQILQNKQINHGTVRLVAPSR